MYAVACVLLLCYYIITMVPKMVLEYPLGMPQQRGAPSWNGTEREHIRGESPCRVAMAMMEMTLELVLVRRQACVVSLCCAGEAFVVRERE